MSRIAKQPVGVPRTVEVLLERVEITVRGPRGVLQRSINDSVHVQMVDGELVCQAKPGAVDGVAQAGTTRSLIANMIEGVCDGFRKELNLVGVGYRAQIQNDVLSLALGFSHPIRYRWPDNVVIETPSPTRIVVYGNDKQVVGQTAAKIRGFRPPEPYKGKGIRYSDENVRRKEAKKKQ